MAVTREQILEYHLGGKIALSATKPLKDRDTLSMAYTPGVAEPVKCIHQDPDAIHRYTAKDNTVAVVTDGSAILGLGDLGAEASIPVMEGKAVLFKAFADVDAWPVPLNNCRKGGGNTGPTDVDRLVEATACIAPMYGGINLEDIAAPACFPVEERLEAMLPIPVFHDDQWGTAVITLAGVLNYCRLAERDSSELRVVINGAGAAGIRIAEMLKATGVKSVILCDSKGVIRDDRANLTRQKKQHAVRTSASTVGEALREAHVFIGVSVAGCIKAEDVLAMASFPAVFAMANPVPEIEPAVVAEAMGKNPRVMATGRSDYPNQINNVLGFPFLFRGALDARAKVFNTEMKVAAARALAELARQDVPQTVKDCYPGEDLAFGADYVVPKPFDRRLFVNVPFAVAEAAVASGAGRVPDLAAYKTALRERGERRWAGQD
ncbi:MAG: malate dehydrogenase [Kiritimatiellae bacterium]|nr:malate dehydrogenase [Kiritimatiellia bacterium]